MIVFHEGLPRSGKSYEACVIHIVDAVKNGRKVITNIEGIDYPKFSSVTGVPINICKMLIKCIYHPEEKDIEKRVEKQKSSILKETQKDSLVVIDEIQNMFPSGREKLGSDWSRFITEHGHDGLDIILMGQDRRDCHNLWRRRIQRVITFTKQTAVGREGHYLWAAYEATRPEVYKKINSGSRQYDKKYFGLYKSHTDGTKNTSNYSDSRINIFKTPGFKYGVPFVLFIACYSIYHLVGFFSPDPETVQLVPVEEKEIKMASKPLSSDYIPALPVLPPKPLDSFDEAIDRYRPRLAGFVFSREKLFAEIHFLDASYHLKDRFYLDEIEGLGWNISLKSYGLVVTKDDKKHVIRAWPIDKPGKVDNHTMTSF